MNPTREQLLEWAAADRAAGYVATAIMYERLAAAYDQLVQVAA